MGVTDQMGLIPLNSAPAAPTWPGTTSATKVPTPAELQAQVRTQNLANMQILFGMPSAGESNASLLPNTAAETAQQIANVSIQSSRFALAFSTITTLFGYNAIGANTNTRAQRSSKTTALCEATDFRRRSVWDVRHPQSFRTNRHCRKPDLSAVRLKPGILITVAISWVRSICALRSRLSIRRASFLGTRPSPYYFHFRVLPDICIVFCVVRS
jgi:hypothetical protein